MKRRKRERRERKTRERVGTTNEASAGSVLYKQLGKQ